MRLAAIYIHKHDFLFNEPQTINLGGKYEYTVKANNENYKELTVTKKENPFFIENFFGNNIELITAIVGSNGSGKSSLLISLANHLNYFSYDSNIEDEYKIILFFEKGNELIVTTKINVKIHRSIDSLDEDIPEKFKLNPVTKKNNYDINKEIINVNLEDFIIESSFNSAFYYNPLQYNNKANDNLSMSIIADLLDEILFLSNQELIERMNSIYKNINFYKSFKITANRHSQYLISNEAFINNNYTHQFEGDEKLYSFLQSNEYKHDNYYIFYHLFNLNSELYENVKSYNFNGVNFNVGLKKNAQLFEIYSQILARLFLYIVHDLELYKTVCKKFIDRITLDILLEKNEFLKLLREIISFILEIKNISNSKDEFYISLELFTENLPENLKLELNENNVENNKKLIESYIDIVNSIGLFSQVAENRRLEDFVNRYFLVFTPEFNISDGEKFLIKLFSKLYSNKFYKTKMSIGNLLLLDEPEIGFHPQWKKKYVDAILKCLPVIIGDNEEKKLQIIFTTHDPLTLSDMPNSNIVYLKKENGFTTVVDKEKEPKKSFGANITDLLADSFFIDDGLIGDFAKEKINEVIKWLRDDNRDNDKKDDYKKIIEMIDEPLIKIKLEEMYSSIFKSDLILNKEREFIRRRAIELGLLKEEND